VRLLLDEMFPGVVAEQLRRRGHEVQAVKERIDLIGRLDEFLLAVAQDEGWTIVTEDVGDFRVLAAAELRRGKTHPGLVFTTRRSFPRGGSRAVGQLVGALDALMTAAPDLTDRELWLRSPGS